MIGRSCSWILVSTYTVADPIPEGVDIVMGFGGGASLDVAKLIARRTGLGWISIPTAASHDGIASEVASVSHNGYKYSEKCKGPLAVIADTSIINQAPPMLKLAGLGDIICKASSLAEWKLAHEIKDEPFDQGVYSMVEKALVTVLEDDSIESLIQAEIVAGRAMSLFGSSRPCSGTEHAISHAMDRSTSNLHGLQVAFATPLCLHYLHQAGYSEYKADDIQEFMRERSMPVTLHDVGSKKSTFLEDIDHALKIMERRNRYSVLRHLDIDRVHISDAISELGYEAK
jgi:glycerol-1-phosphate dehydrogenase [NAD(P)+]